MCDHSNQRKKLLSFSQHNEFQGFLNLLILIFFLLNIHTIYLEYPTWLSFPPLTFPTSFLWGSFLINIMIMFFVFGWLFDRFATIGIISEKTFSFFMVFNSSFLVLASTFGVICFNFNFGISLCIMCYALILFMKLVSFAHVCYVLRAQRIASKTQETFWLSVNRATYFFFAPTLCYMLEYPRRNTVRKATVFSNSVKFALMSFLLFGVMKQHLLIEVDNTVGHFEDFSFSHFVVSLMKICLPNIYIWLLGFYIVFHLYLNIWAEITRFADSRFYLDWWNATTLIEFWHRWNLPVHCFLKQHIYQPLQHSGCSRMMSSVLVFFVSACFHELVISVACRTFQLYAFSALMMQIPMTYLTARFTRGKQIGNIIFWLSFLFGQPYAVVMYYDVYLKNFPANS
eukprot:GCRY01002025.1.p1 GENE.GCRY01002025.1~~GCRY01002025.1.p1  ORF type:complete len:399 (-),score=23.49 GCRY01002025.1:227-1423(-)